MQCTTPWNYNNSYTGHCARTSEVQMYKYKTFYMEINITCTIYWNYGVDGALYTAETWFVAGVTVNTLYKYDN